MTVTIYNRKVLGSVNKPIIPNEIFKETLESLDRGESDFYELVNSEYTLESYQKLLADEKYQLLTIRN